MQGTALAVVGLVVCFGLGLWVVQVHMVEMGWGHPFAGSCWFSRAWVEQVCQLCWLAGLGQAEGLGGLTSGVVRAPGSASDALVLCTDDCHRDVCHRWTGVALLAGCACSPGLGGRASSLLAVALTLLLVLALNVFGIACSLCLWLTELLAVATHRGVCRIPCNAMHRTQRVRGAQAVRCPRLCQVARRGLSRRPTLGACLGTWRAPCELAGRCGLPARVGIGCMYMYGCVHGCTCVAA